MVTIGTTVKVADNSGAKSVKIFGIPGATGRNFATIGDKVVGSVTEANPGAKVKKGDKVRCVLIRTRKNFLNIHFDDNACVLLGSDDKPIGNRFFGPVVASALRSHEEYKSIISNASYVI